MIEHDRIIDPEQQRRFEQFVAYRRSQFQADAAAWAARRQRSWWRKLLRIA